MKKISELKVGEKIIFLKEPFNNNTSWRGKVNKLTGQVLTVGWKAKHSDSFAVENCGFTFNAEDIDNWFTAVGDKVVCPSIPKDVCRGPSWVHSMDNTVGEHMTVVEIYNYGDARVRCKSASDRWVYLPTWIEPVDERRVESELPRDFIVLTDGTDEHSRLALRKTFRDVRPNMLWASGDPIEDPEDPAGCCRTAYYSVSGDRLTFGREIMTNEKRPSYSYVEFMALVNNMKGNKNMTETKNIQQTREEKERAKTTFDFVPAMEIVQINENPKKGCTTVMFADNKRVTVKVGKDEQHPDLYSAVAAAVAIRAYGSNSAFKRTIAQNLTHKKPQKSGKKDHIVEVGDIVRITRRGRDVYSSPSLCGYSDIEVDREMVVAKVEKVEAISLDDLEKIERTMAYVNTPDKIADVQYKIPVDKLYIVRKHEAAD